MKLINWSVQNYKSIRSGQVRMSDLNIVIGENNSGKSNLLDAFIDFQEMWNNPNRQYEWFESRVTGKRGDCNIIFEYKFELDKSERERLADDMGHEYQGVIQTTDVLTEIVLTLSISGQPSELADINKSIEINWKDGFINTGELNRVSSGSAQRTIHSIADECIESWKFVSPFREPDDIGSASFTGQNLSRDGKNLVQKLNSLRMSEREEVFDRICESYIDVMEGVTRVDLKYDQSRNNSDQITVVVEEHEFENYFTFSEISSGSKEILALISQIYLSFENTGILTIEEPELHLHPGAEQKIYNIISRLADSTDTQVIISTHSDVFVNQSDADSIIRAEREGETTLRKVDTGEIGSELTDLGYEKSGLLQSNAVVFVEGLSDKLILSEWASTLDFDITAEGVTIVELEGEGNIGTHGRSLVKLLYSFDIPYLFLIDSDTSNPRDRILEYKKKINREDDDISDEKVWWHTTPDHFYAWEDSDIEYLLLQAPDAIARTLGESSENIRESIEQIEEEKNADILAELWEEYYTDPDGITSYQKDLHGKMIAKQMEESELDGEIIKLVSEVQSLA
ncbi:hypothetical protein DVK00_05040 [Haloarcula sp. Atlit-47R]|uniref:ATP-dependent nuclease n=1 Tax=Haloarcula sp. Atlit-47R TaxID=2282132 RepID=UPI000EF22306|nr:AAA family ATPase [Haloarcula sp. Atlit-47R]RLM47871.1 hypothetical protein DVK00_05040 [Haloarcula sp. Atlit-47R]